jgi:tetratricopeptide (TPR) repeat protein
LRAGWEAAGALRVVTVSDLGPAQLQRLVQALCSTGPVSPSLATWLHHHTHGNVYLALQTLRALFETGALRQNASGVWQGADTAPWSGPAAASAPQSWPLPASAFERVAALLQPRWAGVAEPTRRVMALVALRGHAREPQRLAAAAGLGVWEVTHALDDAARRGFLHEDRFAHDLMRQVVLTSHSASTQRTLHEAIASHFAEVLHPAQLARHWWQAGVEAAAVAATARAVAHYRDQGLQAEAIALLQETRARVAAPALATHLLSLQAAAERERAEHGSAAALATQVLHAVAEPADRARALRVLSAGAVAQGRLPAARDHLEQAALADPDDAELLIDQAQLALLEGDIARWLPVLDQSLRTQRRRAPNLHLVQLLRAVAAAHSEHGDAERGHALLLEAMGVARGLNARHAQVDVAVNMIWALAALGRDEEGITLAREMLLLGDYEGTPILRNNLAWSLLELGRLNESRAEYERQAAGTDPTLAQAARAKLVDIHARQGDEARKQALLLDLVAGMPSAPVPLIQAACAIAALQHGQPAQWQAVLAHVRPVAIDPWLRQRLADALQVRGIDPAPYVWVETEAATVPAAVLPSPPAAPQ